jgi:hypothetical protein
VLARLSELSPREQSGRTAYHPDLCEASGHPSCLEHAENTDRLGHCEQLGTRLLRVILYQEADSLPAQRS